MQNPGSNERKDRSWRERRQQERAPLAVAVIVCGLDETGRFFSERTETHNISELGSCFRTRTRLTQGATVALRLVGLDTRDQARAPMSLFQVAWVRKVGETWHTGVHCVQKASAWSAAFRKAS